MMDVINSCYNLKIFQRNTQHRIDPFWIAVKKDYSWSYSPVKPLFKVLITVLHIHLESSKYEKKAELTRLGLCNGKC